MKIIDIGICIDNNDPKGIGRIRCIRYSSYTGELEKAMDYNAWDDKDLFTASPFLPTNINFIPEKGQAVKIINHDTDKETTNIEYIAGPFTTVHDFNSQTHSAQVEYTTYGLSVEHGDDVFNATGEYSEKKAQGSIAKKTDFGIYGKYGSDILFTEDGLHIRGGKLISKPFANNAQKTKLVTQPIMSGKIASLHLKKYPKKLEYVEEQYEETITSRGKLKYLVEYSFRTFTGTTNTLVTDVDFFVYNTEKADNNFRIENPKLEDIEITTGCTLVNKNNIQFQNNPNFYDATEPTYTVRVTGTTNASIIMRNTFFKLGRLGLSAIDPVFLEKELHPFYFRPTKECETRELATTGHSQNRIIIFNSCIYFQKFKRGLIFSKTQSGIPSKKVQKKRLVVKDTGNKEEQTFASLKSDRVYLLSTDISPYQKSETQKSPINFEKIDKYEPSHDTYIKDVEPNTYALVRGEVLTGILRSMYDLIVGHQHNVVGPLLQADDNFKKLQEKINTLENDILNTSIRIN